MGTLCDVMVSKLDWQISAQLATAVEYTNCISAEG